jgi:hypothetical protein
MVRVLITELKQYHNSTILWLYSPNVSFTAPLGAPQASDNKAIEQGTCTYCLVPDLDKQTNINEKRISVEEIHHPLIPSLNPFGYQRTRQNMRASLATFLGLAALVLGVSANPLITRELTVFERAQLPPNCECCCYPCDCAGDPPLDSTSIVKATPTVRLPLNTEDIAKVTPPHL